MEEDVDFRIRFSSLCFITDHVGFRGTIKSSPSDFVVIEIDEQGQLVNKATDDPVYKISKVQPEPNNFAKKTKLDLQNFSFEERSNQEVSTLAGCSGDDQNHQSRSEKEDTVKDGASKGEEGKVDIISSLLDERTNELLNQFAGDIKEKWSSKTELIGPSPEFSLGRILDKNQRAILHSAIRQKFPFLVTVGKNSEIFVKPNLEYKELCHLVSEEEAFDFFKYLDAKKENSRFTFKPDTNKDHRKAVHHFVNKKFGNLVETKSFPGLNYNASNPNVAITVRFREKVHKHRKRSICQSAEFQSTNPATSIGFINTTIPTMLHGTSGKTSTPSMPYAGTPSPRMQRSSSRPEGRRNYSSQHAAPPPVSGAPLDPASERPFGLQRAGPGVQVPLGARVCRAVLARPACPDEASKEWVGTWAGLCSGSV